MKAVGYHTPLPIASEQSLVDLELPVPAPGPRDLLVAVRAVLVNPVDVKVRASAVPEPGVPKFWVGMRSAWSKPSAPM